MPPKTDDKEKAADAKKDKDVVEPPSDAGGDSKDNEPVLKAPTRVLGITEEAEVLPYESVFDWDCVDPLGYYREEEKFDRLVDDVEDNEVKTSVVTRMWKDRKKYQILRRFTWPPPLFFKQIFLSRGYYEDYECRAGVNVAQIHLTDDKNRCKKESQLKKGAENKNANTVKEIKQTAIDPNANKPRDIKAPPLPPPPPPPATKKIKKIEIPPPVIVAQKKSLSDFDPLIYNRNVLTIKGLPGDTNQKYLDNLFPKGIVVLKPDGKGGFDAEIEFQTFNDAREAFRKAMSEKIGGRTLNVIPLLRLPDSNVGDLDRDDVTYANPYMARKQFDLGGAEAQQQAQAGKKVPPQPAPLPMATAPPPPPKTKGKTTKKLNSYNPLEYDYFTLGASNIPIGTKMDEVQKLFPKGKVTSLEKDPVTNRLKAIITFDVREDAIAAFADNHEQPINGGNMDIVPEKVPEGGAKKRKSKKEPQKPPEVEVVEEVTYEVMKKDKKKKKPAEAPK